MAKRVITQETKRALEILAQFTFYKPAIPSHFAALLWPGYKGRTAALLAGRVLRGFKEKGYAAINVHANGYYITEVGIKILKLWKEQSSKEQMKTVKR